MVTRRTSAVLIWAFAGCTNAPCADVKRTWAGQELERARDALDRRVTGAAYIGLRSARRKGELRLPASLPEHPIAPDGTIHPAIARFAFDEDGELEGSGPPLALLRDNIEDAEAWVANMRDKPPLLRCLDGDVPGSG